MADTRLKVAFVFSSIGLVLAATSVVLYIYPALWSPDREKVFHVIVLGLWFVFPPVWFVVETQYFARDWSDQRKTELKNTQDLMAKLWVGVSALLAFLHH